MELFSGEFPLSWPLNVLNLEKEAIVLSPDSEIIAKQHLYAFPTPGTSVKLLNQDLCGQIDTK
jgi:hypothetical protein